MRTGNSILASMFFFLALTLPIKFFIMIKEYDVESKIPFGLDAFWLNFIIFIVLIALGCVSLGFGFERKKKIEEEPMKTNNNGQLSLGDLMNGDC